MTRRARGKRVRDVFVVVGLIGGIILPFVTSGASSPRYTDLEARVAYGAFVAVVNGGFGALAGWAVGEIVRKFMRDD